MSASSPHHRSKSGRSASFDALVTRLRQQVCRIRGHQRSRLSAWMRGETWYAFCRRCGVRLVRIGPGSWRPLSEEELASEHATLFAANGTAAPAAPLETPPQKKVAKAKAAKSSASKKNSEKAKAGSVRSNAVSAPGQGYEASYLARKHGISTNEARALIKRVGNDRDKLNAAAERLVEKRIRNAQPRAGKER